MSDFDFAVNPAGKNFSKVLGDAYEAGGITCPYCGSEKAERRFAPVARTSRQSQSSVLVGFSAPMRRACHSSNGASAR